MERRQITADVIKGVNRLLAQGLDHPTIASRLGLTEYVVAVVASDDERPSGPPRYKQRVTRRQPNAQRGLDATTIRMIQRMLDVGILSEPEIARQAGVSPNSVNDVAVGNRIPISTWIPYLRKGERFVPESIRCSGCGATISVVPCRVCRTRRKMLARWSI